MGSLDEQVSEPNYEELARKLLDEAKRSFRFAQSVGFAESRPMLPYPACDRRRYYELSLQCNISQMCDN